MKMKMYMSLFRSKDSWGVMESAEVSFDELVEVLKVRDIRDDKDGLMFNLCEFYTPDTPDIDLIGDRTKGVRENIKLVHGVILDYDGGERLIQMRLKFQPYHHVIYTSHSHSEDTHKFRVVLPLAEAITTDELESRRASAKKTLGGIDKSSLDCARRFYLPSSPQDKLSIAKVHVNTGCDKKYFDFKQFEVEVWEPPVRNYEEDAGETRERVLRGLTRIFIGYEPTWAGVCSAMINEGFSEADFLEVTACTMNQKSPEDASRKWRYMQKRKSKLGLGYLINVSKGKHSK